MKLTELKNWNELSPEEQARLKEVYGQDAEITQTMAEKPPQDAKHEGKEVVKDISHG